MTSHQQSKGHIAFAGDFEFYSHNNGKGIYRANINNPIMPDGYRSGRWECSDTTYRREFLERWVYPALRGEVK